MTEQNIDGGSVGGAFDGTHLAATSTPPLNNNAPGAAPVRQTGSGDRAPANQRVRARRAPVPENVQPPPRPAEKGNARAVKHGATSELRLAPRREHHARQLVIDFPNLDDRRRALLADRLARIDLASQWLDEQSGVVRNKRGEIYPIVDRLEKWVRAAEDRLDEIALEQRGTDGSAIDALAALGREELLARRQALRALRDGSD